MADSELLDQVDKNGKVIGRAQRSVFHSDPSMIHPVVHCWLFNSDGEVLWQQRSLEKTISPGKWDMSCGGHILSGHKPEETMKRELEEELGLTNVELKFAEKYIISKETQKELVYLFYAVIKKDISIITLQKEEVEKVEWIDPSVAQQMVLEGKRESTEFIFTQIPKILKVLGFK